MARIDLTAVRKSFQLLEVVHGTDLTIEDGSFTVFVSRSGCGKSTLLRMMAGLEEVSAGEIGIDGASCRSDRLSSPTPARQISSSQASSAPRR